MGEQINKEFEEFQKDLEEKEKRLRTKVSFEPSDNLDVILEDLKKKEVLL